jgi:hypothetical protein
MPRGVPADLIGRQFGDWLVIDRLGSGPGGKVLWQCQCACGEQRPVPTGNLTLGKSRRCRSCSNRTAHHPRWAKEEA